MHEESEGRRERERRKREREVKRMKRSEEPKFPGFVGLPLGFNPGGTLAACTDSAAHYDPTARVCENKGVPGATDGVIDDH
jgi:hypothetical protein